MKPEPILGCLLGGAVGDSLGLPAEGLSRRRIAARWHGEWRHRLLFGKGMLSDDTEHAVMTVCALLEHPADAEGFRRSLAGQLKWWLAALPAAVGMATAKSCLRLWLGFSPEKSGVRSAGNGPAMRSAVIGVMHRDDAERRREYTLVSCRITHTDPRAEEAALMVAEAAAMASHGTEVSEAVILLRSLVTSEEMRERFSLLESSLQNGHSVPEFAGRIGCGDGVSGFAPNTAAVVLYAWLRHRGDFVTGLKSVLDCGGDTDTTGAIFGGIAGAECAPEEFPAGWLEEIRDWPLSVARLRSLAAAATATARSHPRRHRLPFGKMLLRNGFFLGLVLLHGVRRLWPPY